jgi:ABC-type transport system involved in multi-copper enzyme maturation permease subunit
VIAALFWRTVATNRTRLLACSIGLLVWGAVMPVIYAQFGRQFGSFIAQNPTLSQFTRFGGGDLFSLPGAMALGYIHPIMLLLVGIIAVGLPILAVAGERQRGTLEVILARPLSRHQLYLVVYLAGALFLGVLLALNLVAASVSARIMGVGDELELGNLPWLWLNGWLLYLAFLSIAFAASVSFDRVAPALGVTLVVLLAMYLVNVISSLWPDVTWLDPYTLFHYLKARDVLTGTVRVADLALLAIVSAVAVGYAWVVFPRRDLAAPI